MNLAGLDALIHEVIVDANGEDEQLWAFRPTATPERKDGHHPIIYMQCGPIRFKLSARSMTYTS
jgi:hypothetical protein